MNLYFVPLLLILLIPAAHGASFNASPGNITSVLANATAGDTINLAAGNYTEMIILNKTLSLIGEDKSNTFIWNGLEIDTDTNDISGITIQNLHLTGETPDCHTYAQTIGAPAKTPNFVRNLNIDNNIFDGQLNFNPAGCDTKFPQEGVGSAVFLFKGADNFYFTNNLVKNYPHHETVYVGQDTIAAGVNDSFTNVLIANNTFLNTNGIVAAYGNNNNLTDSYVVTNNIFAISGNPSKSAWAIIEISNADGIIINNNVFSNKGSEQIWSFMDATSVFFSRNIGTILSFTENSFDKIHNAITFEAPIIATPINATNNFWDSISGPTHANNTGGIGTLINSTNIDFDPWFINSGLTLKSDLVNTEEPTKLAPTGPTISFDDGNSTSQVAGQAGLPADVVELELNNDTVLDVEENIDVKNGTTIELGGVIEDLTTFEIKTTGASIQEDLTQTQSFGQVDVIIEKAVKLESGTDTEPITITNTALPTVSVTIPDETTILAAAEWTGTIQPPKEVSNTGAAPTGFEVGDTIIEVGSPDTVLIFDSPVTLTLTGVTGPVGYKPATTTQWIAITETCGGSFENPSNPLVFPGECSINNGIDTKIVTYHFTQFGGLIADPVPIVIEESISKGGSGATGVGPSKSSQGFNGKLLTIDKDSLKEWASEKSTLKITLSRLIQEGLIDAEQPSNRGEIPDWIAEVARYWVDGLIPDQHFYDSMKYLLNRDLI